MRSIELTTEERAMPFAKYFNRSPVSPSPSKKALMDVAMDPSLALAPENINDLLNPGYHEVETGWCVMPNGTGYVSCHTTMLGVTTDMINWWFAWHGLEDLRYKLWWPKGHYGISIPDAAERTRVLNPETPMIERFQGVTHHVIEDIGGGPENIRISFMSPDEFGFDMARFKEPAVATLIAANGKSRPVNAWFIRPWAPAMMCHFVREIDGGVEFRSRFWMGYHVINKRPKCKLPPFIKVPVKEIKGLANHCLDEFANLASFLPDIYAEQRNIAQRVKT